MANTYTQLYIHCVFAVQHKAALLNDGWDERLRSYITAIAQGHGHKMLAINNMPDHLHCFIGLDPKQSISEMMQIIKGESSEWINKEDLTQFKFAWQKRYGAFSHSRSQISQVAKYIEDQKEHHQKVTFLDEYKKMLIDFNILYDERYIFSLPTE